MSPRYLIPRTWRAGPQASPKATAFAELVRRSKLERLDVLIKLRWPDRAIQASDAARARRAWL